MDTTTIGVLAAVALVILFLIFKKSSAPKAPPVEPGEEETASVQEETVAEDEAGDEEEKPEEEAEPEADDDIVVEEPAEIGDEESEAVEEIVAKEEEILEDVELDLDEELLTEEEVVEEVEDEEEPEPVPDAEVAEDTEELVVPDEEAVPEEVEEVIEEPAAAVAEVSLGRDSFEQELFARKEKHLAALTEAIENNDESTRERLQVELVAITESLTFLDESHEQEVTARNEALAALTVIKDDLDGSVYDQSCEGLASGDTVLAEEAFDTVVEKGGAQAALAAYQSGCLAENRMDFTKAMERLEKAVELDGNNADYLRSAAMLARKLYQHSRALELFALLEKSLEKKGEDPIELALARRELAYTSALAGRHKEAGALYKKAMVSLSKLRGQDDPEMGVCWLQIGKLQEALGQYDNAEDPYKKALAIMEKTENKAVTGEVLAKLAGLYMEVERDREAIPLLQRLCALKEDSPNPDMATLAIAYGNLAEAYRVSGKYEESEEAYTRALEITEELRGKDHAAVGSILQELAQLCDRQGKKEEAEAHRERASAIFQKVMEAQEAAGQVAEDFKL